MGKCHIEFARKKIKNMTLNSYPNLYEEFSQRNSSTLTILSTPKFKHISNINCKSENFVKSTEIIFPIYPPPQDICNAVIIFRTTPM